jgi:hypothetical protein
VPRQGRNISVGDTLDLVVVRSDGEKIAATLDTLPVERPKALF